MARKTGSMSIEEFMAIKSPRTRERSELTQSLIDMAINDVITLNIGDSDTPIEAASKAAQSAKRTAQRVTGNRYIIKRVNGSLMAGCLAADSGA